MADRTVACGLLVLTAAAGLLTLTETSGVFRLLITLAFVLLAPGWVIAAHLGLGRASQTWSVAVGLGLAAVIVTSTVMVLLHAWHPVGALQVMVVVTGLLLLLKGTLATSDVAKVPLSKIIGRLR